MRKFLHVIGHAVKVTVGPLIEKDGEYYPGFWQQPYVVASGNDGKDGNNA